MDMFLGIFWDSLWICYGYVLGMCWVCYGYALDIF